MDSLPVYTLRRIRRARNIRLTVRQDGAVRVSAPLRASVRLIESFIASKAEWIIAAQVRMRATPQPLIHSGTPAEYLAHKAQALALVTERLAHFNRHYGHTWTKVSIRNQRTRWGSCSRAGALSFNYRVALLPPELVDYLVVHELCHLAQMSHAPKFWALVAETVPEWRKLRSMLQKMR